MKQELPKTLSARIQFLREKINFSKEKLSEISNLQLSIINDIEEGKELFLSITTRQKLAKALRVSSNTIKEVEKQLEPITINQELLTSIKEHILNEAPSNILCPKCGNKLISKIVIMYDLDNSPVKHPKARCEKCPFQIK